MSESTERINVQMPQGLLGQVKAEADRQGNSVAAVVRQACAEYLEKRRG